MEIDLVGSSRDEGLVRPLGVVPVTPARHLCDEGGAPERYEHKTPGALALEGAHQPLDDRDTAVLADGAEALPDPTTPAPAREALRSELRALVADDVVGGTTCGRDGTVEEVADRLGRRFLLEDGDAHD